jgi:membrane associated rhomboid family serine protease
VNDRGTPPVLLALIALNVVVFVLWHSIGTSSDAGYALMDANFLVSVESVVHLRLWTLLTAEFSHVEATHLIFNMLALWVFGRDVEAVIGTARFLGVYLFAGVVASIAYVLWAIALGSPNPALGASGAIMGIGVLFAALFPKRQLLIWFVLPLPASLALGLYVVLDIVGAIGAGDNVAHAAHLGGAAVGLGYWAFALRGRIRRR